MWEIIKVVIICTKGRSNIMDAIIIFLGCWQCSSLIGSFVQQRASRSAKFYKPWQRLNRKKRMQVLVIGNGMFLEMVCTVNRHLINKNKTKQIKLP